MKLYNKLHAYKFTLLKTFHFIFITAIKNRFILHIAFIILLLTDCTLLKIWMI